MANIPAPSLYNDTTDLSSLLPAYQQQYLSLAPAIELAVQQQENARGMNNSGQANDSTAKGLAALLGQLSGESAGAQTQQQLQAQQQAAQAELQRQQIGAQRQANSSQMISSGLGAGLGALGTLGMLKYMGGGKSAGGLGQFQMGPNGQIFSTQTGLPPSAAGAYSGGTVPQAANMSTTAGWQQLVSGGNGATGVAENIGAGALGGFAGNSLSNLVFGGKGQSAAGSALGGLAGGAAGLGFTDGSPWGALVGAGLGAFGGGGLGGLFK